jgi:flagellar biosynthesis chaperone FliJ
MSRIQIGKIIDGEIERGAAWLDVDVLLRTRLLIQANSGKGKSWLLRRICEQLFGKVQVIVIDPEGEFATLREKYAYVLVGQGGETAAHPRIAKLTAERLLELRASAVCDLYELKAGDRHVYVKNFFSALIDAPKKLWHPVVVILDEAHVYCPEKGVAESEASEAVVDMATRGRKRGFALVAATQRLGKLRKDMAAELLNIAIGGTFIDIDRKRAANTLGVYGAKDLHAFDDEIRQLKQGLFYLLGPAIGTSRELVKVGPVETTHPEAGSSKHGAAAPPAPDKVKALLPKLADLPKEAEEKAATEAQLRGELRELKAKLASVERQSSATAISIKPDPSQARTIAQLQRSASQLADVARTIRDYQSPTFTIDGQVEAVHLAVTVVDSLKQAKVDIEKIRRQADRVLSQLGFQHPETKFPPSPVATVPAPARKEQRFGLVPASSLIPMPASAGSNGDRNDRTIGALHRKIAGILAAYYPEPIRTELLATMCGKTTGGAWNGRLSETRSAGLLEDAGRGLVRATEKAAREFSGTWQRPTNTEEAIAVWNHKLSDRHRRMLDRVMQAGGEPVSTAEVMAAAGMTPGGAFNGRLSELRSTGLIVDAGRGYVKANVEALFMAS